MHSSLSYYIIISFSGFRSEFPRSAFFFLIFIYLFFGCVGLSDLSCGTRDLSSWRVGFSLVVAGRLCICVTWAYLPCSMWDLNFSTRAQTRVPCIGRQILNHWTTKEVSQICLSIFLFQSSSAWIPSKQNQNRHFVYMTIWSTMLTPSVLTDFFFFHSFYFPFLSSLPSFLPPSFPSFLPPSLLPFLPPSLPPKMATRI